MGISVRAVQLKSDLYVGLANARVGPFAEAGLTRPPRVF